MSRTLVAIGTLALLAATSTGCNNRGGAEKETAVSTGAPAAEPGAATRSGGEETIRGAALAVEDVPPYTYVHVRTDEGEVWVAGPRTVVREGQTVEARNLLEMRQFHSDTLDRTFDRILFAGELRVAGGGGVPSPHARRLPPGHEPAAEGARARTTTPKADIGDIARASGEHGRTVAEVYSQKEALAGEKVAVRGVVVKFTPAIMGRNWVHIQDGTGEAGEGTHDLTVTTEDEVRVGALVRAEGTVAVDRDFGSGYEYAVLVEDASLSVEQ